MFLPRLDKESARRANRIAEHTFKIRLRNRLVKLMTARTHPFAVFSRDFTGFIGMPPDPVREAEVSGYLGRGAKSGRGHYKMATLAHEFSELYVMHNKAKRNSFGKLLRKHKSLYDGCHDHSSAHPLIAELNHAGKCVPVLKAVLSEWSRAGAQAKVFAVMKQCGWTPVRGIPMYGRAAGAIQRKSEALFAPYFKKLMGRKIKRLERKYKGKALVKRLKLLLQDVKTYAGGAEFMKEFK
jgi:hypothetical protein